MEAVGGIPVECLTAGELAGVWSGWSSMGDREVVREASAKGTHISLAYKFFIHRRHWTLTEAKTFFNTEVETWINELLKKRTVHRASHILKNVGKDPIKYIKDICIKCTDPGLRDYLAKHVLSNKGFEEDEIDAWQIINCVNSHEETINLSKYIVDGREIKDISIEEMINLSPSIKLPFVTELYFCTHEACLEKMLESYAVWNYLLVEDKIKMLIEWIDKKYAGENTDKEEEEEIVDGEKGKTDEIEENIDKPEKSTDNVDSPGENLFGELFDRLDIHEEMWEKIDESTVSAPTKELVLNHLANYGIFIKKEREDIKALLARFFSAEKTLKDIEKILLNKLCNIDKDKFHRNVHSILYYQGEKEVDEALYKKDKELLDNLDKISKPETFDIIYLIRSICQTIEKISDNPHQYLIDNPLITFYLILLKLSEQKSDNYSGEKIELREMMINPNGIVVENLLISQEIITQVLNKLPYIKQAIDGVKKQNDITVYELLDGYKNLNVKKLFKWRFKNEEMPNFSSKHLIKKYGIQEKLTYKYYLKQARPSMAAYILQNPPDGTQGTLSSNRKLQIAFQAHIFGLEHIDEPEIIGTCIAFLEFLSIDSEYLRLHATAANYVKKNLNISINDLLKSITYQNPKDLATVITRLEESFETEFKTSSMTEVNDFISALKNWEFIVQFAKAHNTKLPNLFLTQLAKNNLWFEFVLVVQICRYPLDQVLENAGKFESCNIREHLLLCLGNTNLAEDKPVPVDSKKSKPAKNYIYSRMSRKKNDSPASPTVVQEMKQLHEVLQSNQPSKSHLINPSVEDDLWWIILTCHQSPDPPGALLNVAREKKLPILAVLAVCYEPSSVVAYCYSWLVISVDDDDFISSYADCLKDQIWPARTVVKLFQELVSIGFLDTLNRGLEIFLTENPLYPFTSFLNQCAKYGDYDNSKKYLTEFLNACMGLKSNKMIDWDDADTSYLNNEHWIVTVAIELVMSALDMSFCSTHLQIKFLDILVDENFNDELNINEPDFCSLLQILTILIKTTTRMNFGNIKVAEDSASLIQEIERCIKELVKEEKFQDALKVSKIASLPCSSIILNQYRSEFKKNLNQKEIKLDYNFWKKCAADMIKYDVEFEDAAKFFIEHTELVESFKERFEILELALKTLKSIGTDQQTIDTVEMVMWKSCILAGPESIVIQKEYHQFDKSKTELLSSISNLRVSCVLNDEAEEKAVDALINKFLDIEDLKTALRISAIFNYKHKDLMKLMLCLSLAEGEISPYQLNSQQKALLAESDSVNKQQKNQSLKNRGLQKRLSTSSLNISLSDSIDAPSTSSPMIQQTQVDCIFILKKLIKNLHHGSNVGNKVLLLYKLSGSLKKNYRILLASKDPMEMLYEITGINCDKKFNLISDVIAAYKIKDKEVAKFLAGEIILHITRQVEDGPEDSMLMWGYSLDVCLNLIGDLCSDTSLIGWELLENANLRLGHSHGAKRDLSALKIIVELIIRSHDYFTASCSMEGISSVLKKCQQLTNTLQLLKLWSVMVRLVTGVGRFTEMNYIFKILKENDQFECLLGRGMDKKTGLKIALLEFCKKQCPDDKELFKLIALHFRMYNEIAIMWETEAKTVIRELIKDTRKNTQKSPSMTSQQQAIKLIKNDDTEKRLQIAMANYTHATEYFLQDDKLNLAHRCSQQAQLVALQISLFIGIAQNQQVFCLFNLSTDEVSLALCQNLNFPQSLIVIQAYNHSPDWSSAIYSQFIVNGKCKYFKDFLTAKRLTTAIVQDCTCRYRAEKNITKQMKINMKTLINELDDIECKYVLASQLGFKDIIEIVLSNPSSAAYLKDTVWKEGYKPQEFIGETFRG